MLKAQSPTVGGEPAALQPRAHDDTLCQSEIPPPPEKVSSADQFRGFISQPVVAAFCAGGVAGAVSRTVVSPLERLKILFQVQSAGRDAYKLNVGKALMQMWKEEGWRGFMRGNGTNCIRIVPYSAVQFGSYNFYKRVSRSEKWWSEGIMLDSGCSRCLVSSATNSVFVETTQELTRTKHCRTSSNGTLAIPSHLERV
jgi:hypothetical protein